jgi:uncharacterized protein with HEPN domain
MQHATRRFLGAAFWGMRNAIAHGYFAVDLDIVWNTVNNDLPALAEQVRALRGALQPDPNDGDQ